MTIRSSDLERMVHQMGAEIEQQADELARLRAENERMRLVIQQLYVGNQERRRYRDENARLRAEIEQLRLAMMGGEDAPGYAMSIPLDDLIASFERDQRDWRDYMETLAAQLATAQADTREKCAEEAENSDPFCGRLEIAAAIRALPLAGAASKGESE